MMKPTIPSISQEIDDKFKITPEELEELIKGKDLTPMIIESESSCPYLLPCGICDKTGQMCSQYLK